VRYDYVGGAFGREASPVVPTETILNDESSSTQEFENLLGEEHSEGVLEQLRFLSPLDVPLQME
jgi:hypothetical protein